MAGERRARARAHRLRRIEAVGQDIAQDDLSERADGGRERLANGQELLDIVHVAHLRHRLHALQLALEVLISPPRGPVRQCGLGGGGVARPQEPRAHHQPGAPLAAAAVDGESDVRVGRVALLQIAAEGDDRGEGGHVVVFNWNARHAAAKGLGRVGTLGGTVVDHVAVWVTRAEEAGNLVDRVTVERRLTHRGDRHADQRVGHVPGAAHASPDATPISQRRVHQPLGRQRGCGRRGGGSPPLSPEA